MHNVCILVAVMDLVFAILTQIYLVYGWNWQVLCQTTINTSTLAFGSSIFLTFLFLWWRQRILYANRFLKHLSNKVTQVLSWISIAGIAIAIAIPTISQLFWRKYKITSEVCMCDCRRFLLFELLRKTLCFQKLKLFLRLARRHYFIKLELFTIWIGKVDSRRDSKHIRKRNGFIRRSLLKEVFLNCQTIEV